MSGIVIVILIYHRHKPLDAIRNYGCASLHNEEVQEETTKEGMETRRIREILEVE
jgi:hypothetical protein